MTPTGCTEPSPSVTPAGYSSDELSRLARRPPVREAQSSPALSTNSHETIASKSGRTGVCDILFDLQEVSLREMSDCGHEGLPGGQLQETRLCSNGHQSHCSGQTPSDYFHDDRRNSLAEFHIQQRSGHQKVWEYLC